VDTSCFGLRSLFTTISACDAGKAAHWARCQRFVCCDNTRERTMRAANLACSSIAAAIAFAATAHAQTWSLGRNAPSLFEIIAVDQSADSAWPYGQEDLAGDGVSTLQADEAAVDLRTVYADARANRVRLRAYVTAKVAPTASALAFFFIDTDTRTSTGGKAGDPKIWPALSTDPTSGGYERAVGMRGDGSLLGVWFWDAQGSTWTKQPDSPVLANLETGVARDPIQIAGDDHGYFQLDLDAPALGLSDACANLIFVRTWNDAPGKRSFGDAVDMGPAACRPSTNAQGDPVVLRSDACTSDATCPAKGRCRGGVCLFAYECSSDSACRTDEHCTAGSCVRVVDQSCKASSDCNGLVCDGGRCAACTESGARACGSGLLCAPDGSCIRGSGSGAGGGTGTAAGTGGTGTAGNPRPVRGGAFHCAVSPPGMRPAHFSRTSLLVLVLGAWLATALRRACRGAPNRRRCALGEGEAR
jgi:hypothetical protein